MSVDIPVKDFQKICRVCLAHYETLVSIHEIQFTYTHSLVGQVEKLHLTEFLERYSNVLVHKDDSKPQNVCQICINMLAKAFNVLCLFQVANLCLDQILAGHVSKVVKKSKPHENNVLLNKYDHTMLFQESLDVELASDLAYNNKKDEDIEIEESQVGLEHFLSGEDNDSSIIFPHLYLDSLMDIKTENTQKLSSISAPERDCIVVSENELNMDSQEVISKDEMFIKNGEKNTENHKWDHTYCTRKALVSNTVRRHKVKKPRPKKINEEHLKKILQKYQHKNEVFECQCCEGLVFQGMDKVIDHMKTAHPWTNKCILCGRRFSLTKLLLAHVASHAEKRNLVCKKCVVYCKDKEALDLHYASEDHKSQTFKCKICSREFKHSFRFRRHIREVHDNKGLDKTQCPECGLILKYRGNLIKHLRTHKEMSERKSFLCEHCAKSFTTSTAVRRHVLIKHEGQVHLLQLFRPQAAKKKKARENPRSSYPCDYCSRNFATSDALFKHRISHPECKDIVCRICDETLPNPEAYRRHRLAEHSTYPCDICQKGFPTRVARSHHKVLVHRASKFTCSYCPRQFTTTCTLKCHEYTHTKEKPFPCQFCDMRFTQKHHLNQHISCIHTKVKKHKCHICSKTFVYNYTFKAHLRYHMGCKPFNCPYCTKSFIDTISRHKHVKRVHPDKMDDFVVFKQVYQSSENKQAESLPVISNAQNDGNEINAKVVVEVNKFSSGEEMLTEDYEELVTNSEPLIHD